MQNTAGSVELMTGPQKKSSGEPWAERQAKKEPAMTKARTIESAAAARNLLREPGLADCGVIDISAIGDVMASGSC